MKVILIEEERFAEIRDLMKLKALALAQESNTPERLGFSKSLWECAIEEVQRSMQYHFVKWAQSHGASCTNRL